MSPNREEKFVFTQPKTFEERKKLAQVLVDRLHFRVPVAIDSLSSDADREYGAWPERLYVVGKGGRIAFKGEVGPFGFDPDAAARALAVALR
jgi:type I thyroxine 5'-deiodinase